MLQVKIVNHTNMGRPKKEEKEEEVVKSVEEVESVEKVFEKKTVWLEGIEKIEFNFGRDDLNMLRDRLNAVIDKLNQ